MRVENTSRTNFNARLLSQVTIAKKMKDSEFYKPLTVSCVELDSKNIEDIKALYKVTTDWQYDIFSTNIYNNLIGKSKGDTFYKEYKTFAITSQDNNLETLNSSKIIAVADLKELIPNKVAHITHIQVKPDYTEKTSNLKGIGTSMINTFKQMYSHITLTSTSNYRTKEFYRKNDFIEYPAHSSKFSWAKDIFSMLGIKKDK